jgi:hypothetical protein
MQAQKDGSPQDGGCGKINGGISNQVYYGKAQPFGGQAAPGFFFLGETPGHRRLRFKVGKPSKNLKNF